LIKIGGLEKLIFSSAQSLITLITITEGRGGGLGMVMRVTLLVINKWLPKKPKGPLAKGT